MSYDYLRRVGIIGYRYVDEGTAHSLASVGKLYSLGVRVPVVLKSTFPPGTTDELSRRWPSIPMIFNPEFLRERSHLEGAASPSLVVLGWARSISDAKRAMLRELFERRFLNTPVVEMNCLEAELIKYASNALFGIKVSLANEMADLSERLGVDWDAVRSALVLDPCVGYGHFMVLGPDGQRGFGGKCLPKDMSALLSVAEDHGIDLAVVSAAMRANEWRRRT